MENCIFCKIANDEVPAQKAHQENGDVVSFPDIHPVAPGHTLVVPREHYRWFYEMPDELSGKLFRAAKQLALKLKEETGADYIRLSIVGKDVPHVHIHLVPQHFTDTPPVL